MLLVFAMRWPILLLCHGGTANKVTQMATKKKTAKKKTAVKTVAKRRGNSAPATAKLAPKPDAPVGIAVAALPDGQARTADGTIVLKAGSHDKLNSDTYQVHGSKVKLDGDVFIAAHDVKWLPVKECTCGVERPGPMAIAGNAMDGFVATAKCANQKCKVGGKTYVWVMPGMRLALN